MIEVEKRGFDEQLKLLRNAGRIYDRHLGRAMGKSVVTVQSEWKSDAPILTGRYVNSLSGQVRRDNKGWDVLGIIGTDVTNSGFPYPAALEQSEKYHYRDGPRAGQRTQGHVKRVVKKKTKQVIGYFKSGLEDIVKALEV